MGAKKAVLIDGDGKTKTEFMKVGIGSGNRFDEKWLQDQIFEDISLLSVIDPSFEKIALVPLCREFALHDTVRNVFLDILAVTATGQLVLVECKLWKNPQARREVVAQIFEYASLLKSLSYGDLVAKLKKSISSGEEDPILHQFRTNGVEFDENGQVIPTPENPNALTFDPSYVYAPNQGIRGFIGVRYSIFSK